MPPAAIAAAHLSDNALQAYGPMDEPWMWDVDHEVPDVNGQRWRVGE
jgi:hypothetical protein